MARCWRLRRAGGRQPFRSRAAAAAGADPKQRALRPAPLLDRHDDTSALTSAGIVLAAGGLAQGGVGGRGASARDARAAVICRWDERRTIVARIPRP